MCIGNQDTELKKKKDGLLPGEPSGIEKPPNPRDFADLAELSPKAKKAFWKKYVNYGVNLAAEAKRVARRHRSDTVSEADVIEASNNVMTRSASSFQYYLSTFGGILLGASISTFLGMAVAGQFPVWVTLISAALGIVGAFSIRIRYPN